MNMCVRHDVCSVVLNSCLIVAARDWDAKYVSEATWVV
jgi:hypothetical protein